MRKEAVQIGHIYAVLVHNKIVPVRVTRLSDLGGWVGISLETGQDVRIKTAGKLRNEVSEVPEPAPPAYKISGLGHPFLGSYAIEPREKEAQ